MTSKASSPKRERKKRPVAKARNVPVAKSNSGAGFVFSVAALLLGTVIVYGALQFHAEYAFSFQWPVKMTLQSPILVARRAERSDTDLVQLDQAYPLTAYQQYACRKFGSACRVALAIQRAENPQGKCEVYHYNADGTLDWGYFQINTVHLQRPGLVLRDLLDCRANIDFAYQVYLESHGFTPWSTFNSGAYKKFLRH